MNNIDREFRIIRRKACKKIQDAYVSNKLCPEGYFDICKEWAIRKRWKVIAFQKFSEVLFATLISFLCFDVELSAYALILIILGIDGIITYFYNLYNSAEYIRLVTYEQYCCWFDIEKQRLAIKKENKNGI